ncbi:hypothetical protein [Amycolatopsis taiwanensis]|uniref:hypothetical protein n=1 Tax=Amycolatopsis taiwanensis TaxID=342230 RepID=UPI0004B13A7B|nr:hypothetical protein [Amycolatopsis taiwanensis]
MAGHTGGMIALVPTTTDAKKLAVPGGDPQHEMHLTLAYLGDNVKNLPDQQVSALKRGTAAIARGIGAPIEGQVFGHAVFNPNSTEFDPAHVYMVNGPVAGPRQAADKVARRALGEDYPTQHPNFVPHITAGYNLPPGKLKHTGPVTFDRVRLTLGDHVHDYPIGEAVTLSNTLELSVETPALASVHHKLGKPGGPGLFHDKNLQLPAYIQNIAHALIRQGHDKSRAIQLAIAAVERWARGGDNVHPEVRAAAAKAVAEWEAARARAKAKPNEHAHANISRAVELSQPRRPAGTSDGGQWFADDPATPRQDEIPKVTTTAVDRLRDAGDLDDLATGLDLSNPATIDLAVVMHQWKHGWIPLTPRAAAVKAKMLRGSTRGKDPHLPKSLHGRAHEVHQRAGKSVTHGSYGKSAVPADHQSRKPVGQRLTDGVAARRVNPANLTEEQLRTVDSEFTRRATRLGKPGAVGTTHRAVKAELGRRAAEKRAREARSARATKAAETRKRRAEQGLGPKRPKGLDNAPPGGWTEQDRVAGGTQRLATPKPKPAAPQAPRATVEDARRATAEKNAARWDRRDAEKAALTPEERKVYDAANRRPSTAQERNVFGTGPTTKRTINLDEAHKLGMRAVREHRARQARKPLAPNVQRAASGNTSTTHSGLLVENTGTPHRNLVKRDGKLLGVVEGRTNTRRGDMATPAGETPDFYRSATAGRHTPKVGGSEVRAATATHSSLDEALAHVDKQAAGSAKRNAQDLQGGLFAPPKPTRRASKLHEVKEGEAGGPIAFEGGKRTGTVWSDAPGGGKWVIPDERQPGEAHAIYVDQRGNVHANLSSREYQQNWLGRRQGELDKLYKSPNQKAVEKVRDQKLSSVASQLKKGDTSGLKGLSDDELTSLDILHGTGGYGASVRSYVTREKTRRIDAKIEADIRSLTPAQQDRYFEVTSSRKGIDREAAHRLAMREAGDRSIGNLTPQEQRAYKAAYERLIRAGKPTWQAHKMALQEAKLSNTAAGDVLNLSHVPPRLRAKARRRAAAQGEALPDGSWPIRNRGELGDALRNWGHAVKAGNTSQVKAHMRKRAKTLGASQTVLDRIQQLKG